MVTYDIHASKQKMEVDLRFLAETISTNSWGALSFFNPQDAEESLKLLAANTDIVEGRIYDKDLKLFAYYTRDDNKVPDQVSEMRIERSVVNFDDEYLVASEPINYDNEFLGVVSIVSDMKSIDERINKYFEIIAIVSSLTLAFVIVLSLFMQKIITKPILQLAKTATQISKDGNYSIRIEDNRKDEVGVLVKEFNNMISHVQITNNHLKASKELAEESMLVKEQFLANMSHEIRTPLNGIMGLSDVLINSKMNAEQTGYLNAIKSSSYSLLVIINDILDISKLEAGKLVFEETEFNLEKSIDSVIGILDFKLINKSVMLTKELDENLPINVIGDSVRLNQILLNLVGNAIKFTEQGKITVGVVVLSKSDDKVELEMYVEDTGIGIADEQKQKVFESFTQAKSSTTRKYGGTGLGLTIVKNLVEMHGGIIKLESEEGKGSKFTFNLAYKVPEESKVRREVLDVAPAQRNLENVRILAVEDNPINQMLVKKVLSDWKADFEIVGDGKKAVESMEMNDYDIVLMDIQMPIMDGYTASTHIRKMAAPKNEVPIIALTAHVTSTERDKCLSFGMSDYISKPFKPADLYNKIVENLDENQKSI